jgi:GDSL-like Lipase/Acylhydrolase
MDSNAEVKRVLERFSIISNPSEVYLGDQNQAWGYPKWIDEQDEESQNKTLFNFMSNISLYDTSQLLHQVELSTKAHSAEAKEVTSFTLRPSDIACLVCFGDSLLAGLCAISNPSSLKNRFLAAITSLGASNMISWILSAEHRQNTCISGGRRGVVSVGRLLKYYSPNLIGLNTEKTYLFSKGSEFNFSRTGSSSDSLRDQVQMYLKKLRKPMYHHLHSEWKLVYIWIGANDVFKRKKESIGKTFEANLVAAIQALSLISKTFVCLVTLPDLSHVKVHTQSKNEIQLKCVLVNEIVHRVAEGYEWNSNTFRVVLQPIPFDSIYEEERSQFVSSLDMMHPSLLMQQLFAKCLWDNLFLKPDNKLTTKNDIVEAEWFKPQDSDIFLT